MEGQDYLALHFSEGKDTSDIAKAPFSSLSFTDLSGNFPMPVELSGIETRIT
jgi:hypothetical protein